MLAIPRKLVKDMGKSNGSTRNGNSSSPRGLGNNFTTTPAEDRELESVRNAITRYNEAKTASAKERARFSVNFTINNIQTRIELALSNDNSSLDERERNRLRKYYDLVSKMRV